MFNVPSPYNYHFPNFVIRGAMSLVGYHSFKSIWASVPLFRILSYSMCKISSIFNVDTWSKNFKKN